MINYHALARRHTQTRTHTHAANANKYILFGAYPLTLMPHTCIVCIIRADNFGCYYPYAAINIQSSIYTHIQTNVRTVNYTLTHAHALRHTHTHTQSVGMLSC